MFMMKKLLVFSMLGITLIGQGVSEYGGAQGRLLARRAAIVDVYRQCNGAPIKILNETYTGGIYTVKAEVR